MGQYAPKRYSIILQFVHAYLPLPRMTLILSIYCLFQYKNKCVLYKKIMLFYIVHAYSPQ